MTTTLTTETFKSAIIDSGVTALVDFHADWCGPCRAQGPIVDAIADTAPDGVIVAKVDIEANHELAHLFQIQALPTLLVFRDGRIARRFTGLTDRATLTAAVA
jgi:thioredoxin 1